MYCKQILGIQLYCLYFCVLFKPVIVILLSAFNVVFLSVTGTVRFASVSLL